MPPQDIPAEVKSCKAIADDKERLRCFDGLFGGPSKPPKTTRRRASEKSPRRKAGELVNRRNQISATAAPERLFRTCRYCAARPSIWCWRDHSAGKSARRATPMPCGSRPSMAAMTRSGARKASEIVIVTLRTLHRSRLAMLSVVAVSSVISSSSQRRPRAIDATKVARFSERIGRACCGDIPSGTRIARRRLDIVFCQETSRAALDAAFWRSLPCPSASWMINCSG